MPQHWDVIVIGAGTAGRAAWRKATEAGKRAALVDGGVLGTTCARVGCMPSKLLIAAAHAARDARDAHKFGADIEREPVVDGAAVLRRVRAERDRFVGFVMEGYDDVPEGAFFRHHGRFQADGSLLVGDTLLTADAFVVAVGSRSKRLPFLDALGDIVVDNEGVFEWETLPKRVAVFGPGVIGLELGLALAQLGVRVRIFGRGGFVGPLSDPKVRDVATAAFSEHVFLDPDADVGDIHRVGDAVSITFSCNGERVTEQFDAVVQTVGRASNTDRVGLENLGFEAPFRVDPETQQLGDSHIFIAGDANDERPLLHEAADDGVIAGQNAASFPNVTRTARRSALGIVFTDPDIAMVGERFDALDADDIVIGEASYADQGRARSFLRNRGLLRIYADKLTGRFRGAEMVAPDGEHLAHLLAWAHQQRLTVQDILAFPFYHPVVEEGVRTALRDAQAQLNAAIVPQPV